MKDIAKTKVYCVEDDRNIRELVIYTLESGGYQVKGFSSSEGFWQSLKEELPDLILLDLMLPGEDGMKILERLKRSGRTKSLPVILVTAKGAEYDKVKGLDCGADDYITKPFGMMEFIARVKAVLRRSGYENRQADTLIIKGLKLQVSSHQVTVEGEKVELTLKEFELLKYLMDNSGIVLTRDQILTGIWGYDYSGETRTVDVHIRSLRQKLGICGDLIETVRGVGYRIGE